METVLGKQLDSLKNQSRWFSDSATEEISVLKRKHKQKEFVSRYQVNNMDKLQAALCQDLNDSTFFQEALREMPPKLVTLLGMLLKIDNVDLARTTVSVIFEEENSDQRKKTWAQILHQLLTIVLPDWDNITLKNLDQELLKIITKKEEYEMMGLKTMEAVFEANLWPGLELLYTEHKDTLLGKVQLNRIMILAAWDGNCSVFMECLKLGANLTETVDVKCDVVGFEHVCVSRAADRWDMKYSILHEAVKHGLDLEQLELAGGFPKEMVNHLDCCGNTLLNVAIIFHTRSIQRPSQLSLRELLVGFPENTTSPQCSDTKEMTMKNVLFLMKHKADVNIANKSGMTAIQHLSDKGHTDLTAIDMLVAIVQGAEKIEPHSWAPVRGWTVLSLLCFWCKYQHVLTAVEKGADAKHLCFKLTLIDMVILQEHTSYDLKELTLAVLLNKPVSLGAFHASVVAQRPLSEENMAYRGNVRLRSISYVRKPYIYPAMRLLSPLTHTRGFQSKCLALMKMMVQGGAVCDAELLALKHDVQNLKNKDMQDVKEYLLSLIEALKPSVKPSQKTG